MRKNRRRSSSSMFEPLESRVFLSATALARATAEPTYQILHRAGVTSDGSSSPSGGISPAKMQQAYGVNAIQFGGITGNGAGQTIAIIDANNDPNAASDLAHFDSYYGLPAPPSFTQLNESGGTTLPSNGTWGVEESLDIEWAHVMAPAANIILYEASSASDSDLISTAVTTAKNNASVTVVSMSFGGGEFSSETSLDSIFTSSHVTFLASSGDNGSPPSYPAASPNVVAVGGTTLSVSTSGAWQGETAWNSSGGGTTSYESEPAYQRSVQSTGKRTNPDISMDANPNTGVPVYDSFDEGASTPWITVGGTSLASPMMAGVMAIINQGRIINGLSVMSTVSNPSATSTTEALPLLYQSAKSNFHDITSGNNGGFSAGVGYDEVTGIGSPIANKLVPYMAGTKPTVTNFSASPNPEEGGSDITLSATVTDPDSTVTGVSFYEESNGTSGLQTGTGGDTYLGPGILGSSGQWTITTSSTGLSGTVTFYAVPTDASGVTGATANTTETVLSSGSTAVTLTPASAANPSDATESLTFTANVSGGVPDGEGVALEDASNYSNVVATGTLSGGSATLAIPAGTLLAGTHDLVAVYGGDSTFSFSQSDPYVQTVQVVVTNAQINGNLPSLVGAQRSMVDDIVYSFSEAVNLSGAAAIIAVHNGQGGTAPSLTWTALNPNSDGSATQWAVSFSGAGVTGISIANGVYDITLNASAVTSDADPAVSVQPRATDTFFRLFGDVNGDGVVNATDNFELKTALSTYNPVFDYNDDGVINAADNLQFKFSQSSNFAASSIVYTI